MGWHTSHTQHRNEKNIQSVVIKRLVNSQGFTEIFLKGELKIQSPARLSLAVESEACVKVPEIHNSAWGKTQKVDVFLNSR